MLETPIRAAKRLWLDQHVPDWSMHYDEKYINSTDVKYVRMVPYIELNEATAILYRLRWG